ncbi:uncharacterized protein [Nicotiana tomentosiformis]|uniref:uncharacterized protein n=1 Tax=Nicotiana tomentosiformis TaxID=4098 RepID=UPI00388CBBB1
MLLSAVPDEWATEAFTKGLNPLSSDASKKLKKSLLEFQETTLVDVHNCYESKTIEDDKLSSSVSSKGRPSQMNHSLWWEFHGTHGHMTRDCRHLRAEVAMLLKNIHFREFLSDRAKNSCGRNQDAIEPEKLAAGSPCLTINMIFGGVEVNGVTFSTEKKINISVTHVKRIQEASEDDEITFTEEDADCHILPHNNTLVISLNIFNFKIKRVLVDPDSSANVIQWRVLEQAKLTRNIVSTTKLLAWFYLTSVTTRWEILLPTHAEGVEKTTLFYIVVGDMGYNVIIGRPWIHEIKVMPSNYHQLLKFPMLDEIKKLRGDQPAVREMNEVTLSSSNVISNT